MTVMNSANASAAPPKPTQNQWLFLSPLGRFRGNIKNANEGDIHLADDRCEKTEYVGAGMVVLGLAVEFALALVHLPYDSSLERWGGVGADFLVALGVLVEVIFAQRCSKCASELTGRSNERLADAEKEAADARERAANAERETEKLRSATAWRWLSQEEHEALVLELRNSGPGASVRFCVLVNDQESLSFAYCISAPFRAAGWMVGFRFSAYTHDIMTGLLVPVPNDGWLDEMKVVNGRVRDAFIAAGIIFANGWPLEPFMYTDDNAPLAAPIAWVYVGPKPMPLM